MLMFQFECICILYSHLIFQIQSPSVDTLVLPKVNSPRDLDFVSKCISESQIARSLPLRIVASIESATALWHIGDIANWRSDSNGSARSVLTALLVCEFNPKRSLRSLIGSSVCSRRLYVVQVRDDLTCDMPKLKGPQIVRIHPSYARGLDKSCCTPVLR